MTTIDRRTWLAATGAFALAPSAWAAGEARVYDYLFLDLEGRPGTQPARALAGELKSRAAMLAEHGGEVLGLFAPQLGWRAGQAAVLIGWRPDPQGRDAAIAAAGKLPGIRSVQRHRLEPTARPVTGARPQPGGIYVHRWFVVEAASVPEFVELSVQGWRDFEVRFETRIFGLFTAERTAEDKAAGVIRLLLITRYKDHGVWEASRDPTTEAMAAFARRQKLTRDSWAASTLLQPLTPEA